MCVEDRLDVLEAVTGEMLKECADQPLLRSFDGTPVMFKIDYYDKDLNLQLASRRRSQLTRAKQSMCAADRAQHGYDGDQTQDPMSI